MLLDEPTPAEQEAWNEVDAAERELELAQLRLAAVLERGWRRRRGHLRLVGSGEGEPCDARR
jgi:hypothetical protein